MQPFPSTPALMVPTFVSSHGIVFLHCVNPYISTSPANSGLPERKRNGTRMRWG